MHIAVLSITLPVATDTRRQMGSKTKFAGTRMLDHAVFGPRSNKLSLHAESYQSTATASQIDFDRNAEQMPN
jgi:hypothetical protein